MSNIEIKEPVVQEVPPIGSDSRLFIGEGEGDGYVGGFDPSEPALLSPTTSGSEPVPLIPTLGG